MARSKQPKDVTPQEFAKKALGLDWEDVESQARMVCYYVSDLLDQSEMLCFMIQKIWRLEKEDNDG